MLTINMPSITISAEIQSLMALTSHYETSGPRNPFTEFIDRATPSTTSSRRDNRRNLG